LSGEASAHDQWLIKVLHVDLIGTVERGIEAQHLLAIDDGRALDAAEVPRRQKPLPLLRARWQNAANADADRRMSAGRLAIRVAAAGSLT
jgi:hypothetical protein